MSRLNPETVYVESFEPEADSPNAMADAMKCTGCPSGCGIFPENP
ncbi:MAG TPA: hypothetical protein VGC13_08620 [Longimicrobium sp.]|jgi:hypothetical protein